MGASEAQETNVATVIPIVAADTIIPREMASEALSWPDQARALVIRDQDTYECAGAMATDVVRLRKQIEAEFKPSKEATDKAHKAVVAMERKYVAPLAEAEKIIKGSMATYSAEQERERRAEQARLQEIARRQEEDKRLAEAEYLAACGEEKAAEARLDAPIAVPVVVAPPPPRAEGVSFRDLWSAEVVDLGALIKHVAAHPEWANLLTPNMTALNQLAKAQKEALNMPGVRALCSRSTAVRTK